MTNAVRYSLLRILLFLGSLLALWLAGLHDPLLLILVAATISMLISLFALKDMRDAMSVEVAQRVEQRRNRNQERRHDDVLTDEEAEEIEAAENSRARSDSITGEVPGDPQNDPYR
ncbi:DUF4229 domain-containing protein [Gephyromycinifex aptenodytis]|uniref:DUF4229 domain-containing protein n=1 Tax=Gephyromycinifex aptenodytis TaxID=2716227 RepID=UPI0014460963|nr:DUF4229 domain-containing protein [Gephyromycinifex aptenodytis]